jgi:hypothetical protein
MFGSLIVQIILSAERNWTPKTLDAPLMKIHPILKLVALD